MGTRGYRVTRFRRRYYRFYNHWDSYPEGLGKDMATEVPADPTAYQEWLAQRRQEALGWHNALERFLCRKNAEEFSVTAKDIDDLENEGETGADTPQPWGVATDVLPDFTPAFNDLYIEWIYTIDLDNEVFTIDNGAHVHLIRASDLSWIEALAHGFYGDKILLPGYIPKDATADIVIKLPEPSSSILDTYTNLDVKIVQAKGLHGFPPSHKHGPLLRSRIFYFFREIYEPILAATLMSWRSEDLIFRDIAYAVLSLASADLYPSIVSGPQVLHHDRIACAALKKEGEKSEKEFISHLGVGSHLKDVLPGSSPDSGTYWFGSVLIHLVAQLFDRPDIVNAAVVFVVEYCQSERPSQRVDVILMSIEHVILMKIDSDGRVELTEPLPLFDIQVHTTMSADARYPESDLEELQTQKESAIKRQETRARRWRKKALIARGEPVDDELKDISLESGESEHEGRADVEDQTSWPAAGLRSPRCEKSEAGFAALNFFLEASSRRQLPPSTITEGVFSNELYRAVLLNIEDVETQRVCMQVSRNFRDMCQEDIVTMNKFRFQANEASKTYYPATSSFPALRMKNMSEGCSHDVVLTRVGDLSGLGSFGSLEKPRAPSDYWRFVVGSECHRRSLVPSLVVAFDQV